jgi:NTE family protein
MPNGLAAARAELLERVPLFSYLSPPEREAVADLLREVSYAKGDLICTEGEEAQSFLIIMSGEVEIVAGEPERLINRLRAGDFIGEVSLLMGGPRSATARVSRAARLLELDREVFDRHFKANARVTEHFARVLSQRLASSHRVDAGARRTLSVGVTAEPGLRGKSLVASVLAGFLKDFSGSEVLLLRVTPRGDPRGPHAVVPALTAFSQAPAEQIRSQIKLGGVDPAEITIEVDPSGQAALLSDSFAVLLDKLGVTFPYVVFDLPSTPEPVRRAAEQVCDATVCIVEGMQGIPAPSENGASPKYNVVNLFNDRSIPLPLNRCDPYVLPFEPALTSLDGLGALAHLRQNRRTTASASMRRLARKILGRTLGIAVGGGAAFGISHVGVFEVLEANDIEVDLLAGTSMGSIVACGYAAGLRASDMRAIARRIGNVPTTLSALDFTITKPGLLAGKRLIDIFAPLIGDVETFEQLQLPVQFVATDIRSGEAVHMGTGRLDQAFRASASVPMLWSPVKRDGRVLVDGAIVDPVPAKLVTDMGADICIAVNVVPPLREGVETVVSRVFRRLNLLNPLSYFGDSRDLPNMFDVAMNSIQMLQHELGNFKSISADIRIVPDLSEYTWIEFYRAEEFIERGVEAAEKALPEIRRVLAEYGTPVSGDA